jgi:hypothetical protein
MERHTERHILQEKRPQGMIKSINIQLQTEAAVARCLGAQPATCYSPTPVCLGLAAVRWAEGVWSYRAWLTMSHVGETMGDSTEDTAEPIR